MFDSYVEILLALRAPYNRRRSTKETPHAILSRLLEERVQEPGSTKTVTNRDAIITNFLGLVHGGKNKEASKIFWQFMDEQEDKRMDEAIAESRVDKDLLEVARANAKRKNGL